MSSVIYQTFKVTFATLYPAYASYKAVKTKNVKDYVSTFDQLCTVDAVSCLLYTVYILKGNLQLGLIIISRSVGHRNCV